MTVPAQYGYEAQQSKAGRQSTPLVWAAIILAAVVAVLALAASIEPMPFDLMVPPYP